jgi:hemerythrin-like domain-containing protein
MNRREILVLGALWPLSAAAAPGKKPDEGVGPVEDLMREHGVLRRILLVYDEAMRQIAAGQKIDAPALHKAASLVRSFVEDYHEKDEEQFIFPRLEKKLPALVATLRAQHQAGRKLTDQILEITSSGDPKKLTTPLSEFNRMYRAHAAREDTVLFPALHAQMSEKELDALGEKFEQIERTTFHGDGFDLAVDAVAAIERAFGISDLATYTPV